MTGFYTDRPPMVIHDWMRQQIKAATGGGFPWSEDFRAIAHVVDGKITAAISYDWFTGTACQMHIVAPGTVTKGLLRRGFWYPFGMLKLKSIFTFVGSGNELSLNLNRRLGLKEVGLLPGAHHSGDIYIFQMTREQWKASPILQGKPS